MSFQEIVHSDLTEEAEVAELSDSEGKNRMDTHKTDTKRSRGDGAERDRSGADEGRRRKAIQHHSEDGRQMGRTDPRRRCGWFARSLVTACTAIEALRLQRHTGKQIAAEVGVCPATVSRILQRLGLNRMRDLVPAPLRVPCLAQRHD